MFQLNQTEWVIFKVANCDLKIESRKTSKISSLFQSVDNIEQKQIKTEEKIDQIFKALDALITA